jgi:hypothetical protein
MLIREAPKRTAPKELKVNIPVRYHLQLHQLKVVEGRQMNAVVREALDLYFRRLAEAQQLQKSEAAQTHA